MSRQISSEATVFEYNDYRSFLQDRFEAKKQKKPQTSLQLIASKAKVSKTYLRYVLTKKRHLSLDKVPSFATAFGLNREEREYFFYLLCENTCTRLEMKQFFKTILGNLQGEYAASSLRKVSLTAEAKDLFGDSLQMTLHALARTQGFQPDARWIQRRLSDKRFSLPEIKKGLKALIDQNHIFQDPNDGQWKPSIPLINNRPSGTSSSEYRIYKTGLSQMWQVLEKPECFRPFTFSMMTLALEEELMSQALNVLNRCREELLKLSKKSTKPTEVLAVSLSAAG